MSGDLARNEVKAYPKTQQLVRKERKYRRKIAGAKRWAAIADAKQGRCRICDEAPPNELHHIVPRGTPYFGSDTEANIAPLCQHHHRKITERGGETCRRFLETLTDAEYAHAVESGGENFFERAYGLRYEQAHSANVGRSSPDFATKAVNNNREPSGG